MTLYQSDYLSSQIDPFPHTHIFDPIQILNKAIPSITASSQHHRNRQGQWLSAIRLPQLSTK